MEETYCSICGEELPLEERIDNSDVCIECSMKNFIIHLMKNDKDRS